MRPTQFTAMARLCGLFHANGISAICSTDDEEDAWAWLKLKDVGGELGTYEVAVMDVDADLTLLLARNPRWSKLIAQKATIKTANERLHKRLPVNIWEYNEEVVTVTIGENVFFLIVANACVP